MITENIKLIFNGRGKEFLQKHWVTIVIGIFMAGMFWASFKDMPTKIEKMENCIIEHDKRISLVEKDIVYIKDGIALLVKRKKSE